MAFTNLAVFGGAFFTPILAGKITHTIKWWWTFYLVSIFCAACLPAIVFLCPETAYRRDAALNTDLLATDETAMRQAAAPVPESVALTAAGDRDGSAGNSDHLEEKAVLPAEPGPGPGPKARDAGAATPKVSYAQSLRLFNGRKTDEAFWKLAVRPFVLFLQPAFLWAAMVQSMLIGWTVFIGVILGAFFLGPPLWWDEVSTGYAYTSAFIGAILGFAIAGGLADWSAKALTRLNGGIYEPEFRLVLVIPQMVFGVMGLFGWGITSDGLLNNEFPYVVPLTFFAFEVCGMVIGAVASSLYMVDAYRACFSPFHLLLRLHSGTLFSPVSPVYVEGIMVGFADNVFVGGLNRRPRHRRLHLHDHLQELLRLRPDLVSLQLARGRPGPRHAHI